MRKDPKIPGKPTLDEHLPRSKTAANELPLPDTKRWTRRRNALVVDLPGLAAWRDASSLASRYRGIRLRAAGGKELAGDNSLVDGRGFGPRPGLINSQPGRLTMIDSTSPSFARPGRLAWNKGKLTGPKPPLRPGHVWSIRAKLQDRGTRSAASLSLVRAVADSV